MQVLTELERRGLLLLSDARLPSVASLVAGEPIRGSWWGHPRGPAIFHAAGELAESADVLTAKLVAGKVTYIHRKLWPALLAVATSGEPWQVSGLSAAARQLLKKVERIGTLQTHGATAKELETRLLVHSREIHTESGAHAKILESWDHWKKRVGLEQALPSLSNAKRELEAAAAPGRLPW